MNLKKIFDSESYSSEERLKLIRDLYQALVSYDPKMVSKSKNIAKKLGIQLEFDSPHNPVGVTINGEDFDIESLNDKEIFVRAILEGAYDSVDFDCWYPDEDLKNGALWDDYRSSIILANDNVTITPEVNPTESEVYKGDVTKLLKDLLGYDETVMAYVPKGSYCYVDEGFIKKVYPSKDVLIEDLGDGKFDEDDPTDTAYETDF